jgi:hypothetical protein
MDDFLTMQEDITLDLIFECLGEPRYNRTADAYLPSTFDRPTGYPRENFNTLRFA